MIIVEQAVRISIVGQALGFNTQGRRLAQPILAPEHQFHRVAFTQPIQRLRPLAPAVYARFLLADRQSLHLLVAEYAQYHHHIVVGSVAQQLQRRDAQRLHLVEGPNQRHLGPIVGLGHQPQALPSQLLLEEPGRQRRPAPIPVRAHPPVESSPLHRQRLHALSAVRPRHHQARRKSPQLGFATSQATGHKQELIATRGVAKAAPFSCFTPPVGKARMCTGLSA